MSRPRKCRLVSGEPDITYFKPRGIRIIDLEEVALNVEELEAIRLRDLEALEQEEAAQRMNVSRPTFHRIVGSARKKIADALVNGKAVRIEGGSYILAKRGLVCGECGHAWEAAHGFTRPSNCPNCKSTNVRRADRESGQARLGKFCKRGSWR